MKGSLFCLLLWTPVFAQHNPNFEVLTWDMVSSFGGGPRDDGSAFSLNGKGYYGCGADINFNTTNDWWCFEPELDLWERVNDLPGRSRQYAAAFASDEFGYLVGGILDTGSFSNQVFKFNPMSNSWEELESAPFDGRAKAAGFRIGEYYYYGSGRSDSTIYGDFWRFNLRTEKWNQMDSLPFSPRYDMVAFSASSKGYFLLGEDSVQGFNEVWEFDPTTESWTELGAYPGMARTYTSVVSEPGGAVVGGGMDQSGNLLSEAFHFDVESHQWKPLSVLPIGEVRGMEGFRINNEMYFVGGLTNNFTRVDVTQRLVYSEDRNGFQFNLWPIPARDELWISVELGKHAPVNVDVFSAFGGLVGKWQFDRSNQLLRIDLESLCNGIYTIRLSSKNLMTHQTIMVMN